jgi:hypothetical protein
MPAMQQRYDLMPGVATPVVPWTPQGAIQLEAWRDRQLVALVVAWAVPTIAFLLTLVLGQLSLKLATGLMMMVCVISGALAPGLSVVFLLRRFRAGRIAATLPSLPSARLHTGETPTKVSSRH